MLSPQIFRVRALPLAPNVFGAFRFSIEELV